MLIPSIRIFHGLFFNNGTFQRNTTCMWGNMSNMNINNKNCMPMFWGVMWFIAIETKLKK